MSLYKKRIGEFGEKLAKNYLISRGYKIISCNKREGYKEIDIIANISNKIVFIEVKTRTNGVFGSADNSLTDSKMACLGRAASIYLENNNLFHLEPRIDLIAIDLDKKRKIAKVKHYKDIL